jgi:hypothetical protein
MAEFLPARKYGQGEIRVITRLLFPDSRSAFNGLSFIIPSDKVHFVDSASKNK